MNIYDIAKEAGVSISTVSRVMNNKGNVNAATRKKVEAILDKHDYTPSAIARGMVSKTMKTVAVLTVDIRVPHYARTVYTIEREFSHRGYEVAICNTGGELEETAKYLKTMLEKKVDGIVLVGSIFNTLCKKDEIGNMIKNTPVVLANGKLELPNSYSVLVDDRYGVSLAVEHLPRLKSEGFIKALESHGVSDAKQYVIDTDRSIGGGIEAVEKLIAENKKFTAIVCGEDITATGAVKAALRAGLRVPEDVAVTGYNNSEYARICEPRLTTIDNKPEMVAMMSVQLLTSLIEQTDVYSSCVIQPELVEGKTT